MTAQNFPIRLAYLSLLLIKDIASKQEINAFKHELPLLRAAHGEHNVMSHDVDTGEPLYQATGKDAVIENAAAEQERLIKRFGAKLYKSVYADIDGLRSVLLKEGEACDEYDDESPYGDDEETTLPNTAKELKAAIVALGGVVANGAKLADLQAQYIAMTAPVGGADDLAPQGD